ncbi:MAG: hypothetical protein ACRDPB_05445 [Nocardioidaceae bacterium]
MVPVCLALGASPALASPSAMHAARLPAATTGNHFIANLGGSRAPAKLGFTVFDTGDSSQQIRHLPRGVKSLVWMGQGCPTPADASFRRTVRRLAKLKRVFGYFLSDEPHVSECPGGPKALASRASYIRKVSHNRQKSFVVLDRTEDYHAFRPKVTHLSMIGLDPYPCSTAHPHCRLHEINEAVNPAVKRGIPRNRIVPVYQVFGQQNAPSSERYYNQPTARQLRAILTRWAALVPHPPMDYTYGWRHQDSANPTLVDSTALQQVLKAYFAR